MSVENVILSNIYSYQRCHHWLIDEWHLVPNGVALKWKNWHPQRKRTSCVDFSFFVVLGVGSEHPSFGMLRPSHPISMCIEQKNIVGMLREYHHLSMYIEHHRTHIRCWYSLFPQTGWSPIADWMKACLKTNWSSVQRTNSKPKKN